MDLKSALMTLSLAAALPAFGAPNPDRDAYFGETHIHTSWSVDAWVMGNRITGPDEAFKYAQGQVIKHPLGFDIKIETPLDFMGVTDHSEYVGITKQANTPGSYVSTLPEAQPFGRPVHLANVAATIDRADGVDYVENVILLHLSMDGVIAEEESAVGIRIGVVARVGEDTRLGGVASRAMRRLRTDRTGEAETVLVQPWELLHVQLARNGVHSIGGNGFALGAEGEDRG